MKNNINKIIWKDVDNYEGVYEISNTAIIRRKDNHQIKKQHIDNVGYYAVSLWKDGVGQTVRVHRILAKAFIPNPNNYPCINHKDEDKDNNCVSNLEWCDRDYNMQYGKNTRWHCMPVAQYTLDGRFVKRYDSIKEASNVTGIHSTNIANCAHKRIVNKEKGYIVKSAGGFKWEFILEL